MLPTGFTALEEKMKIQTLLLSLAALSAWTATAQVNIPILNPRFDMDVLPCAPSCYEPGGITGWIIGTNTAVNKLSTAQFPDAPSEGLYVAAIGNGSSGSILQTLGPRVQANMTYTLTVILGGRADSLRFTGYAAALMAGNVPLASDDTLVPAPGTFLKDVIVYKSGANPAQLGQALQIFIRSLGTGQVDILSVSLMAN